MEPSLKLRIMENIKLAASLICAHPLRLEEDFIALKDAEIDLIHFDYC